MAQAIVASKMAPAQRYIHQQYWKNQREVQKQAQQHMQRMARSLDAPNWAATRTGGRQQTLMQQLMQVSWALQVGRSLQSLGRSGKWSGCLLWLGSTGTPAAAAGELLPSKELSCALVSLGQCALWARST